MPSGIYLRSEEHKRNISLALKDRRIIIPLIDVAKIPEIGEIRKIRRNDGGLRYKIWHACPDCGKECLVEAHDIKNGGRPIRTRCPQCSGRRTTAHQDGDNNPNWKGGRLRTSQGYIQTYIFPDDFFYPMKQRDKNRDGGRYVLEHRLIMAKHLNRCLLSWEVVHHKNGVKDDNRWENLELLPAQGKHNTLLNKEIMKQAQMIRDLQTRVTLLEAENILLKNERLTPAARF